MAEILLEMGLAQCEKLVIQRVGIAHINRKLKVLKIVQQTYRSHQRFGMSATLIATLVNANVFLFNNTDFRRKSSNESSVSLENMPAGLYLTETNTIKGHILKKLVKE